MISDSTTGNTPVSRTSQNQPIILFGEILADVFSDRSVLGGAPFNVARHLRALGKNPVLISRLGHDGLKEKIIEEMTANEMDTRGIQCGNRHPTGHVQVHMDGGQHRFEILPEQAYDYIHPGVVRMTTLAVNPVLVYFGTLAQRNEVSRRALKSMMRSTGCTKFLDVNLRSPWYDDKVISASLQYADIIKLNEEELEIISGMIGLHGGSGESDIIELMKTYDIDQAVITKGKEGSWQIDREGRITETPIRNQIANPVDTVGAGDGFAAVYILGSLLHWPETITMERANAFAAGICEIRGAIPEEAEFYEPYLHEWSL